MNVGDNALGVRSVSPMGIAMDGLTDAELVALARAGRREACGELIARYQGYVYAHAHGVVGRWTDAQDVTQEVFIRALGTLGQVRDGQCFAGWLRRVTHSVALNWVRKQQIGGRRVLQGTEAVPEAYARLSATPQQLLSGRESAQQVLTAIASLPPKYREPLEMYYLGGMSHRRLADFLDIPLGTAQALVHRARQRLRAALPRQLMHAEVDAMVTEAIGEHQLPGDFSHKVLENVPRVAYGVEPRKSDGDVQRCPEDDPFPSCLRACFEFMGHQSSHELISGHGGQWWLNHTYVSIMGTSGAAFRLLWREGDWFGGNVGLPYIADDPAEPVRRACDAMGRACSFIFKPAFVEGSTDTITLCDDAVEYRRRIVESIGEHGRPVIACGVVGPPEPCIITGYDDDGDILIGWSFFQGMPDFAAGLGFEPGGYFRKADWGSDLAGIVLLGDEQERPALRDVYRVALRWGVELARRARVRTFHAGHAAYTAWVDAIQRDDELPANNMALLRERHMAHDDAVCTVAEARWYAMHFVKRAALELREAAQNLQAAAACFEVEHDLMWKVWGLVGGMGRSGEQIRRFADPVTRRQIVPLIMTARDKDVEATGHIERALELTD
ncbi:MAG: RNA polymerase sigma factor [Phycisphaerae bacterium]|nr:RNA polymerase sigma factor [Phycisphaerae bacterium]